MTAWEYLEACKPKLLYIAFDETGHFAHGGLYDQYPGVAHAEDAMMGDLWNMLQSIPRHYRKIDGSNIYCQPPVGDLINTIFKKLRRCR